MVHSLDYYFCSLSSLLRNRTVGRRKVPAYVLFLSLSAATGGLMFGYDIGISGGVTVMDDFLCQFFPEVLEEKIKRQGMNNINIMKCNHIKSESWHEANHQNNLQYCLFRNQKVQLFTSSLYFAAMVATIFAAYVNRQRGCRITIILASIFYLVGVGFNIVSCSIHNKNSAAFYMLIFGRIMLGFGVGFGNQAIPLFISDIAPTNARGSLNYLFQLNITIGIFFANIVNWKAQSLHLWGWCLSLGLAGAPAILFLVGSFCLIESPSSLLKRGMYDQAQEILKVLQRQNVNNTLAFQDMVVACNGTPDHDNSREANSIDHYTIGNESSMNSSKKLFNGLFARSNRPPLLITIFVQFFQQFGGINVVILYAPVLFTSFGSRTSISLLFVFIIGFFNVASATFSILVVDRIGRRRLLLVASGVMLFTQLLLGIMLVLTNHRENVEKWHAIVLVVIVCLYVGAFECSWGPLAWLISTEIFPLVCRSEGQSVAVFFNMLFTFVIAHASLSMLCTFKYGIFFFFAAWVAIMGCCSFLFLPETMNIDIDMMNYIWSYHRFWKHFVGSSTLLHSRVPRFLYTPPHPSFPHLEMSATNMDTLHQEESARYI